jgi:hypothetical protein
MLAHISTTRSQIKKSGFKSWTNWNIVEAHLDQTIPDFLGALSKEHKKTCSQWIETWLKGKHQGNDVLMGLIPVVNQS